MLSNSEIIEIAAEYLKIQPEQLKVKTKVLTYDFHHLNYKNIQGNKKNPPIKSFQSGTDNSVENTAMQMMSDCAEYDENDADEADEIQREDPDNNNTSGDNVVDVPVINSGDVSEIQDVSFGIGHYQLRSDFSIKKDRNKLYFLHDYNMKKSGKVFMKVGRLLLDGAPIYNIARNERMTSYTTKKGTTGFNQNRVKDFVNVLFDSTEIKVFMYDEPNYQTNRFTLQLVIKEISII